MVVAVLIMLLLLAPDFAEVSVGVVSLRRLVEAKAGETRDQIRELQNSISILNRQAQSQISVSVATLGSKAEILSALSRELGELGIPISQPTAAESPTSLRTEFLVEVVAAEGVLRSLETVREIKRVVEELDSQEALEEYLLELDRITIPIAGHQLTGTAALTVLLVLEGMANRFEELIARSVALRDRMTNSPDSEVDRALLATAIASLRAFVSAVAEAVNVYAAS